MFSFHKKFNNFHNGFGSSKTFSVNVVSSLEEEEESESDGGGPSNFSLVAPMIGTDILSRFSSGRPKQVRL
jgi:hypothetical protein